jgi:glutamyl endopeptidase
MATKPPSHKPISNRHGGQEAAKINDDVKQSELKTFAEFIKTNGAVRTKKVMTYSGFSEKKIAETGAPLANASSGTYPTEKLLEVVIGDDDRVSVESTTKSPWRKIAALRIKSKTGKLFVGTGWFIGPKVLVTAGHCVYLHKEGGWASEIEVIPGLDKNDRPFGSHVSTYFYSVEGWVKDRNSETDYAVIVLNKPIGDKTGWFGFGNLDDVELKKQIANISGYPLDLEKATKQYYHSRKLTIVSSRKVYYDIDTYGGQSGSPVWLNIGENERIAIAIHTTGGSTSNNGTRIIKEVFDNLKTWKKL